jgi:Uma2 family endonuclease
MNALSKQKMTIDDFLLWSERQPKEAGRFELWDGEVVEKHGAAGSMNAQRANHVRMKGKLFLALQAAFAISGLHGEVFSDGVCVPMPNGRVVEPDALVYLGPLVSRNDLVVPNPIIVCEVLSPSTARFDLTTKLQGYFELPCVMHYLIGDPDVSQLVHHWRGLDGTIGKQIISDSMMKLRLDPPGLLVDLGQVLTPLGYPTAHL